MTGKRSSLQTVIPRATLPVHPAPSHLTLLPTVFTKPPLKESHTTVHFTVLKVGKIGKLAQKGNLYGMRPVLIDVY